MMFGSLALLLTIASAPDLTLTVPVQRDLEGWSQVGELQVRTAPGRVLLNGDYRGPARERLELRLKVYDDADKLMHDLRTLDRMSAHSIPRPGGTTITMPGELIRTHRGGLAYEVEVVYGRSWVRARLATVGTPPTEAQRKEIDTAMFRMLERLTVLECTGGDPETVSEERRQEVRARQPIV